MAKHIIIWKEFQCLSVSLSSSFVHTICTTHRRQGVPFFRLLFLKHSKSLPSDEMSASVKLWQNEINETKAPFVPRWIRMYAFNLKAPRRFIFRKLSRVIFFWARMQKTHTAIYLATPSRSGEYVCLWWKRFMFSLHSHWTCVPTTYTSCRPLVFARKTLHSEIVSANASIQLCQSCERAICKLITKQMDRDELNGKFFFFCSFYLQF